MTNKTLRLIGLAKRAGKLVYGTDCVESDISRAACLLLSCDAGNSSVRNARHLAEKGNIKLITLSCDKTELGRILGKSAVSVAAVLDENFASAICDTI